MVKVAMVSPSYLIKHCTVTNMVFFEFYSLITQLAKKIFLRYACEFSLLEMKVTMIVRLYLAKINVSESANVCSNRIMSYHINILYRGLPGVLWLICAMILV